MRSHKLQVLAGLLLVLSLSLQSVHASAQDNGQGAQVGEGDEIKGDIAGTVGLGLLGAEVGLLLTPIVGLQKHWWAWALFPTLGAAGGVVAGIFVLDPGDPGPAVTGSLMGAGLALAIPAVVGALAIRDRREHGSMERKLEGGGVVRLSRRGGEVGVPSIGMAPVYSAEERARFDLPQRHSLRVSLVSGRF